MWVQRRNIKIILELFGILIFISLALISIGFYTDSLIMQIVGFVFIIILGGNVLATGIDYNAGSIIIQNGSTYTVTPQYANYSNFNVGFYLVTLGLLGFVMVYFNLKRTKPSEY